MNLSFAALYGLSALSLFGLAIATGYLFEHGRSAWRRWRCKQEIKRAMQDTITHGQGWVRVQRDAAGRIDIRRIELEALATARDKAERKIH